MPTIPIAERWRHPPTALTPIWQDTAGRSALYLGDTRHLLDALAPASVDAVWTDPPYLLSRGPRRRHPPQASRSASWASITWKGAWDAARPLAEKLAFHAAWIDPVASAIRPGGSLWVSGSFHSHPAIGIALEAAGFRILNDIVWVHPNPMPNLSRRCFTHATELLFFAVRSGARHTFHDDVLRRRLGSTTNVWTIGRPRAEETRYGSHPTQKPVELVVRSLLASTNPGELILDPFAGSGTTGVAAILTGRAILTCEADPTFAEIARRRLAEAEAIVRSTPPLPFPEPTDQTLPWAPTPT